MPGTDPAGAAGFSNQVNHHLVRVFDNALLLSVFSAGVQLSQIPSFGQGFTGRAPMKLKPVQTQPDASLKGRVPGELHAALTAYTTYYQETTGQPIDVWSLIVQMLQRFVETDREFQAWRRRTQNGPGAGPTTS